MRARDPARRERHRLDRDRGRDPRLGRRVVGARRRSGVLERSRRAASDAAVRRTEHRRHPPRRLGLEGIQRRARPAAWRRARREGAGHAHGRPDAAVQGARSRRCCAGLRADRCDRRRCPSTSPRSTRPAPASVGIRARRSRPRAHAAASSSRARSRRSTCTSAPASRAARRTSSGRNSRSRRRRRARAARPGSRRRRRRRRTMSITQHINVTFNLQNSGVPVPGSSLVGILSYKQLWPEYIRLYSRAPDAITDGFAADSPEVLALTKILGQQNRPPNVAILRGTRPPTQKYALGARRDSRRRAVQAQRQGRGRHGDAGGVYAAREPRFRRRRRHRRDGQDPRGRPRHDDRGRPVSREERRRRAADGSRRGHELLDQRCRRDNYKFSTSKANALANVVVDITAAAGGGTCTRCSAPRTT
jgi:hypothetical protein